jgi:hypothetical protein
MRTIHYQLQSEDLKLAVKRIVQDLEDSHAYQGKLLITRVLCSRRSSTSAPAGDPHLIVEEEKSAKLLGLIPYRRKKTILIIKEGFYDVKDTGSKDMFVVLRWGSCETVARKHLEEYGKRHQVTQVVYWGRNRFRPQYVVSL